MFVRGLRQIPKFWSAARPGVVEVKVEILVPLAPLIVQRCQGQFRKISSSSESRRSNWIQEISPAEHCFFATILGECISHRWRAKKQ